MAGLKEAIEKLKDAVGDLTSLEVQTITGNISAVTAKDTDAASRPRSGGSIIDWTKAVKNARTSADVQLVLATKINFDGDATLFIRNGEIPDYMRNAHEQAVSAGLRVRSDLMNLAKDTIQGLLPKP